MCSQQWEGVPTEVCLSICETICLYARESVYTKGNRHRRRMRSGPEPAPINNPHMWCWSHTQTRAPLRNVFVLQRFRETFETNMSELCLLSVLLITLLRVSF